MSNDKANGASTERGLAKQERSIGLSANTYDLNLDLVNDPETATRFLESLVKGRSSGVNSVQEAMMVYGRCRELNLPFMSTIDHMSVIGGKVCADIHIKNALALRAGSTLYWERTRDYEPQYKYSDGASEWLSYDKPIKFLEKLKEEDPIANRLMYTYDEATLAECTKKNLIPFWNANGGHNKVYNYVTTYEGFRLRKMADNSEVKIKGTGTFSSMESHIAKLGYASKGDYAGQRDPNGNWGKYEKRMTDIRALDNFFKEIASDLMMGMPEISEMAEVYNLQYSFEPNTGNASLISNEDTSVSDAEIVEE